MNGLGASDTSPPGASDIYRQIVDVAPDAIVVIDGQGTIVVANRQCESLLGWLPSQLLGRSFEDLLPAAARPSYIRNLQAFRTDSRTQLMGAGTAITALRADGTDISVDIAFTPIQTSDGTCIVAAIRDAMMMRQIDQSLRDSEARTKASLDGMLDGFAILRSVREDGAIVDFEWVYVNKAAADAYGHTVEFTLGERLRELMPGVEASGDFDVFCRVVETGETVATTQKQYADETISGVFDALVWRLDDGIAVTWRDVGDRERALDALKSNEERFRASVEQLNEALSVLTAVRDDTGYIVDFRWEFANRAASDVAGFASGGLVGRSLLELFPGQATSGMMDIYRTVVESGQPYGDPSRWHEMERSAGGRDRRAFDIRAVKLDDGFVVVTRDITEQLAQVSALARQQQELERSNAEMRALNVLADMLQSCSTSDEAYSVIEQSCATLFGAFSGSISIMHPSRDLLDSRAQWGGPVGPLTFAPTDCWALRRGRPYVSGPVGPRCGHLAGAPARQCLCVPMIGQSEAMGVVHLMRADDESVDFEDGPIRHLAVTVAGQLAMAFANLRLRDSLREMSIRDPLTGLFNRRFMEETLDRDLGLALRSETDVGIIVLDVDFFKAFNDTYGHEAGDAILEAVGEVLTSFSRASDVACRFGGEEFMMILPGCSIEDTRLRADELRRRVSALRVPFRNIELSGPTVSCGIAAYPAHGLTSDALIRRADKALYAAKQRGRDQVAVASRHDAVGENESSGLNSSA